MSLKVVSVCFSLEDKRQTALGRGVASKPGLLPPPRARACSVSYNYAWEYFLLPTKILPRVIITYGACARGGGRRPRFEANGGELRKGPKSACVYVRGHARASWPGRREATCACAFLLSELELELVCGAAVSFCSVGNATNVIHRPNGLVCRVFTIATLSSR